MTLSLSLSLSLSLTREYDVALETSSSYRDNNVLYSHMMMDDERNKHNQRTTISSYCNIKRIFVK
jgi:hypothetical protein